MSDFKGSYFQSLKLCHLILDEMRIKDLPESLLSYVDYYRNWFLFEPNTYEFARQDISRSVCAWPVI